MSNAYAVVKDGIVINMVVWDGVTEWQPDEGMAVAADEYAGIGWSYDGEKFTPPPVEEPAKEELVAATEADRQSRIDYATTRIIVWQTKLLMGRKLTSQETEQLNKWVDYIDALAEVDTSKPDWPEQPE